ncbi:MAG: recombinase family protein, partial [Patescibacteria group bacterium]|nr:recombinase family protein [Patescibacteria group bacterium]
MFNYFLYARKSTDVEDKQVRSIEDQLAVLHALAKAEGLKITEEFVEKQSAKVPSRPIFNDMLLRIEKGEARGIVCWKLDRLARNPVDGGQISWFLQRGIIQHIQTHDRSYLPTDNVLMMSVEFGMANQYILDLSTNTKRGLQEKAKRGEYPSLAPVGYINDSRTKTVIVDRKKAKVVRAAFELYAKGNARLEDVSVFLSKHDISSALNNRRHKSRVSFMLSNPFYYGLFRYAGELHEGTHKPIISKKLFDKVQEILNTRGKSKRKLKDPKPLCGLIRCGECGRMITAEVQKGHTYYRCTKRRMTCSQPYIREEALGSVHNLPPQVGRTMDGICSRTPNSWPSSRCYQGKRDRPGTRTGRCSTP